MAAHSRGTGDRQAVVVLGMHRSGTSALAGVLARLGCALPRKVMPANEFNPRGFYESLGAYTLNDALLERGGGSWAHWQPLTLEWMQTEVRARELARGAQMLEQEFGTAARFVLKDPRICRLLPYWRALFDQEGIAPVYVHTHRSPLEVARSLERREGWPLEVGLLLWLRYELEAEAGTRGQARASTSYARLLGDWRGVLADLGVRAGLDLPAPTPEQDEDITGFLSADLRHSSETLQGTGLAESWFRRTHAILDRWAETGEAAQDYAVLDQIRSELDAASTLFHAAGSVLPGARSERPAEDIGALEQAEDLPAPADLDAAFAGALAQAEALGAAPADEAGRALLYGQMQRSLRLMQIAQVRDHEAELGAALASHRRQAQARLQEMQAQLHDLQSRHDQARALVLHREAEIARLRADLDHQIRACEALGQQQSALLGSTSWKLTAPLRRIVNGLRR